VSLTVTAGLSTEDITVTLRPPEELPEELSGFPNAPPHIDIEPHGVVFEAPATLTRRVNLADVRVDPLTEPVPVGVLAIQGPDETWAWADDASFVVDLWDGWVEISGAIDTTGRLITFTSGALAFDLGFVFAGNVGDTLSGGTRLLVAPTSEATITALDPTTADASVAVPEGTLYAFEEPFVTHRISCVGPGTTDVEAHYELADFGDDNPMVAPLGLGDSNLRATAIATATCAAT
jgi:hypothetical protein